MEKVFFPSITNVVMYFIQVITGIYNWLKQYISVNYLLLLIFGYATFSKLYFFINGNAIDVSRFRDEMFINPILRPYASGLAYIVPITELIVCILLAIPKTKLIGYYASLILLCSFTGYLIYTIVTLPSLPFLTGGVVSTLSWNNHLILNIAFILFTTHAIYLMHKRN
jgi:hypothetical protein